jgi:hypothetical protein
VLLLVLTINLYFLDSESNSAKFDDVSKAHIETVGQAWVQQVLGVPYDLPSHLNVVFVRVFLDALVVKNPVLIVFVNKTHQVLNFLIFIFVQC